MLATVAWHATTPRRSHAIDYGITQAFYGNRSKGVWRQRVYKPDVAMGRISSWVRDSDAAEGIHSGEDDDRGIL